MCMSEKVLHPELDPSWANVGDGAGILNTSSPKNPDGHGHGRGKPCLEESTARLGSLPARALSSEPSASPAAPPATSGAKVAGAAAGAVLLVMFHAVLVTQREQQDRMYREKIESLQEEVLQLKSYLREAERARFKGRPTTAE
eukprot:s4185_g5.t2